MKQFSRFLVVGVLNTLLGYCIIFAAMYWAGMTPETSNMTGYGIGLVVSYVLNRNYTFNSKQRHRGEIIRFIAVFLVAYASNFIVLLILINQLNFHAGISQVLAGIAYVVSSFIMNKYYVFKASEKSAASF